MFQAYFDESGIQADSAMFALAGYVAPEKEWRRFVPKWQAVLDKYDIKVFHASECNVNEGEFRKFKHKREERNEFVKELLSNISQRPRIWAFNSGVAVKDFPDKLVPISPKTGHPYYVAMKTLLAQIGMAMGKFYPRERVTLVFDRQRELSAKAVELFNLGLEELDWEDRRRFSDITYGAKDDTIPLQPADALAYDSFREFERRYYHPERKPRPSYAVLAKNLKFKGQIWDQKLARRIARRL